MLQKYKQENVSIFLANCLNYVICVSKLYKRPGSKIILMGFKL